MSSPKRNENGLTRRQVLSASGLLALLPLGGCFRPLYGQRILPGGENLLEVLRTVDVQIAGGRVGQVFRNELLFLLRGGKDGLKPEYRLEHQITPRVSAVSVQVLSDVPQSFILNLSIVYTFWNIAENRVVLHGTSFAEASFTFSNQRFANSRAYIDAQERAAKVIADEVRTRLVTFFAEGTS